MLGIRSWPQTSRAQQSESSSASSAGPAASTCTLTWAAVRASSRSRGVGYALKLGQRALCLDHGVREMRWTYDPLIAHNAYFNLIKLGGEVEAFLPDFYGVMDDVVNAGDHSDRFEVVWRLDSDRVAATLRGTAAPKRSLTLPDYVAVPKDFDAVRRGDPPEARRLRLTARSQLIKFFAAGLRPEWAGDGYRFAHRSAEPAPAVSAGAERRD